MTLFEASNGVSRQVFFFCEIVVSIIFFNSRKKLFILFFINSKKKQSSFASRSRFSSYVEVVQRVRVLLVEGEPLDLHGGSELPAGDAQVGGEDGPPLHAGGVGHGLLVGAVDAALESARAKKNIKFCSPFAGGKV